MTSRDWLRPLAAVRGWAVVGALVIVSTVVRTALAKTHPAPWIFDDELIYSGLARSLADTGHFAVRGVPGLQGYGPGYPALIAPAYAVFDNLAHAYAAAKAINSLLMSLSAFPAYYLARRVVNEPLALLAAVFALVLPSLEYTSVIMTENAFYAAFLFYALALVSALERPTVGRQLLVLAAIGGAFLIRAQAVALAAAMVTAIVAFAAAEAWTAARPGRLRSLPSRLGAFAWTWGGLAIALLVALVVQHARGRSLSAALGAYRDVTSGSYSVRSVARWYLYHLAELDLYLGFVPLAALLVIAAESLRRRADRPRRAFAAVSVSLLVWVPLTASTLSSQLAKADGIGRIEERNVFYVAPLCLIALLAWVERRACGPWLVAVPAAALAAALPWTIPYSRLVNLSALSDTLAFIPLARQEIFGNLASSHVARVVGVAAIVAALLFLLVPRALAVAVPILVLAYLVGWQVPVERQMRETSAGVLAASIGGRREWIDEAVRGRGVVAAIWTGNVNPNTIAENEFFNGSLQRVYALAGSPPLGQQLSEVPVTVDAQSGRLLEGAVRPLRSAYVLTDPTLTPAGRMVARDRGIGMTLYRTAGPVRLRESAAGMYGDRWSGSELTYVRYGCRGGTLAATVAGYPGLVRGPQRVVAYVAGRAVARISLRPAAPLRRMRVSLRATNPRCVVVFRISPTAVPAQVLGGFDTRVLGVRFDELRYEARERSAKRRTVEP